MSQGLRRVMTSVAPRPCSSRPASFPPVLLVLRAREVAVLISCWSSKGGAGTTVVAAALAITLARPPDGRAVLADLAGDALTVLGVGDDPTRPGLAAWL